MRVVVIDNFDSFTFNLVHILEQICNNLDVVRNNEVTIDSIQAYDKIIISPGPGLPSDVKILDKIIKTYHKSKAIFGVCLGHQAIIESFGGSIFNLNEVHHGTQEKTIITSRNEPIYRGIPNEFSSGRYHSWAADRVNLPDELVVTAVDETGLIMSISHKTYNVKGVQFHPESLMTPYGFKIIENWINL